MANEHIHRHAAKNVLQCDKLCIWCLCCGVRQSNLWAVCQRLLANIASMKADIYKIMFLYALAGMRILWFMELFFEITETIVTRIQKICDIKMTGEEFWLFCWSTREKENKDFLQFSMIASNYLFLLALESYCSGIWYLKRSLQHFLLKCQSVVVMYYLHRSNFSNMQKSINKDSR